jgi:hypothetical protein
VVARLKIPSAECLNHQVLQKLLLLFHVSDLDPISQDGLSVFSLLLITFDKTDKLAVSLSPRSRAYYRQGPSLLCTIYAAKYTPTDRATLRI